ncbi:FAD-dependent oxidoreductase [Rhodovulum adriaticum]|uniref:Pyridine nucleotide-disulfide oxidoreductase n=1 Tax=Rhodovulum adriaticum TaxID=35804 RepID=A0A4V2SL46_RHOAD|nr:FAD-dependent oxidoreductase [Rhodovulum adriaticum]MBK1637026.1 sulfide dehydrogenase [Rhodovulum adriaticum]TCP22006.1 pyridine nucleotide-disulfide oxidoreductase [Rhodovulum adriaticum]
MQTLNRRRFAGYLAAGAATAIAGWTAAPHAAHAQAVIVGAGPAGAAAALALKGAQPARPVLLVERDPTRMGRTATAAFDKPAAGPGLDALRRAGVQVVLDDVADIDWRAARLELFSGRALPFDQLLLAPGTAARPEPIAGLDAAARHRWPAAWGNAREARRLRAQLAALPAAGHVVLRLPATPGHQAAALNRALHMATWLHHNRPNARFSVLDGGTGTDLAARFHAALDRQGLDIAAKWHSAAQGGTVLAVDAPRGVLDTNAGRLRADVVNFVLPQGAGAIARRAGLVDASDWCPTDARGLSTRRADVAILGDARKSAARTVAGALQSGRAAAALV